MAAIEERIQELAVRQHGVVTRAQLLASGLTASGVRRRVRKKGLRVVHRGVYLVGPLPPPRAREMAAVLACDGLAHVSHGSAARLWDCFRRSDRGSPVDVRIPNDLRIRRPGIRVHRTTSLEADEVGEVEGIPVTAPGRTVVDLAAVVSARDLERAVARAGRLGLVTPEQLLTLVERHRGRPGVPTLANLVRQIGGPAFTRSALEDRFVDEVRRFGLPSPRFNQRVCGHELDCYWADARMAVELDGAAYHAAWGSHESDRRRDRDLSAAGIQVVRVTWRQLVHDTDQTMVRVAEALAISRDRIGRAPIDQTPETFERHGSLG